MIAYISGQYRVKQWRKPITTIFYPVWIIYKYIVITRNILRARKYAIKYWEQGFAVICPHLNSAYMDDSSHSKINFIKGDLEFINRMGIYDILVLIPGWGKSNGSKIECMRAKKLGITIIEEK